MLSGVRWGLVFVEIFRWDWNDAVMSAFGSVYALSKNTTEAILQL